MQKEDKLIIGGHEFHSRFILGSGKYSLKLIEAAVKDAGAEIITLAVRRANTKDQEWTEYSLLTVEQRLLKVQLSLQRNIIMSRTERLMQRLLQCSIHSMEEVWEHLQ